MSKPKSVPVAEAEAQRSRQNRPDNGGLQEPLSGSKKTKQKNHTPHNNPQG